jgi:hypothetical protein
VVATTGPAEGPTITWDVADCVAELAAVVEVVEAATAAATLATALSDELTAEFNDDIPEQPANTIDMTSKDVAMNLLIFIYDSS